MVNARRGVAFTCLALLILAVLGLLARELTARGIDAQGGALRELYAEARSPWDFRPRRVQDLVAGRALGAADARATAAGIELRSRSGAAYTVGVPLPWPVDLRRWGRARVALEADAPVELRWTLRERADGPLLVSAPALLPPRSGPRVLDLRELTWANAVTGSPVPAPPRAVELHLRLEHRAGSRVSLRAVTWEPDPAAGVGPAVLRLEGWSAEQLLAARDRARAAEPARVLVVRAPRPAPRFPGGGALAWLLAGAWLVLAAVAAFPRRAAGARSGRELLVAAVCVAPFLAWALQPWGAITPAGVWQLVFVAAVVLVFWLGAREHGHGWRWIAAGAGAWSVPAASVLLVGGLLLAGAAPPDWPAAHHALLYVAWALLQQLLMLGVIAPRLLPRLPGRALPALALAAVFALAHAPNGLLMQGVFLMELAWAWSFLRHRALLPIVLAHAACGLLLAAALPGLPLRSLEVGVRFLG